jgi:cell division initiation protein
MNALFLTPKDIHDKTFKRSFKGYDENEVDEFLDLIIKEFNLMIDENERLRQEIVAKPVVQEYSATSVGEIKRLEGMLAQAIEAMNKNAQIMAQTGLNVQSINQDMKAKEEQEKALENNNKLEEFKKAVESYKLNFESLIKQQKKQLNEKYKEIFGEERTDEHAFDEADIQSMTGAAFNAAPHIVEPPKEQFAAEKPQFMNAGDQQPGAEQADGASDGRTERTLLVDVVSHLIGLQ